MRKFACPRRPFVGCARPASLLEHACKFSVGRRGCESETILSPTGGLCRATLRHSCTYSSATMMQPIMNKATEEGGNAGVVSPLPIPCSCRACKQNSGRSLMSRRGANDEVLGIGLPATRSGRKGRWPVAKRAVELAVASACESWQRPPRARGMQIAASGLWPPNK